MPNAFTITALTALTAALFLVYIYTTGCQPEAPTGPTNQVEAPCSFSKGSIVQLKSGGPVMTVTKVGRDMRFVGPGCGYRVTWFDSKDRIRVDAFPEILVKEAK